MLFEFFIIFLNIEKNKMLRIFVLQYFMFSSRFMLFPTLKKNWCTKKNPGGGCFVEKQSFLISRFMLFSTLKKDWKVILHLLVKWEVVSPNSR